ncbi:MAG: hypothetical protein KDA24_02995 [Deltaproteobacteria bacterium]|nr:hypothetical protein [Deltaproteobacteria bacterium]
MVDDIQPLLIGSATLGCVLWVITYLLVFRRARQDGRHGFPALALGLNLSWEITWTLVVVPVGPLVDDYVWLLKLLGWAWLVPNCALAWQWFSLGGRERAADGQQAFVLRSLVLFSMLFAAQYGFAAITADRSGQLTAFVVNLVNSAAFLVLLGSRPDGAGLSYGAAWTRMLGTVLVALPFVSLYPIIDPGRGSYMHMHALYLSIFSLDLVYVLWLGRARRRMAA